MAVSNLQKKILDDLCKKHKITIGQGEEIFNLMCQQMVEHITENKKEEHHQINLTQFKGFYIEGLGRFVPKVKMLKKMNELNKKRKILRDESTT